MAHPEQFENVTVQAKANVYFDGKVVSHTLVTAEGAKITLGLIHPGTYHFNTGAPERMDITSGACRVRLDGQEAWETHAAGGGFDVPGNSGFDIAVEEGIAEYICAFLA